MPRLPNLARPLYCVIALCIATAGCDGDMPEPSARPPAPPVVVYAARDADLMRSVLDEYTDETGISVVLTTESGRSLIDRLSAEKHSATADLVILDSIGRLWAAVEGDLFRPSRSELLETSIPNNLRDPDRLWFALLVFDRIIAYDNRETEPELLTSYAALGDEEWCGKLCLSSASDIDNQSHVAMMIADYGVSPAERNVRAWIANLAIPIVVDDATLLRAIEDGQCSVGVVDSNSFNQFRLDEPNTSVERFVPPASEGGSYINIVGAAVARHANNPAGALQLLEWLVSGDGQYLLSGQDLEVPVSYLEDNSVLQISAIDLAGASYHFEQAVQLMERAHYGR